jgi:hypothetical protein
MMNFQKKSKINLTMQTDWHNEDRQAAASIGDSTLSQLQEGSTRHIDSKHLSASPRHQLQYHQTMRCYTANEEGMQIRRSGKAADQRHDTLHSLPKQVQTQFFQNGYPQLSTIDLAKSFVAPEKHRYVATNRIANHTSPNHRSNPASFHSNPPLSAASSLVTYSEIAFTSPEAAIAATNARSQYLQHLMSSPLLGQQLESRARPLTVPDSSPR